MGARWLEDAWPGSARVDSAAGAEAGRLLPALHRRFGGQANLAILLPSGEAQHYAGNTENPVFAFRLGDVDVVSTGIYSLDRSLFRFVAPGASERRLVRQGEVVSLDRNGKAPATS